MTTPIEGTTPRPWWFEDGPHIVHGTRHVLSKGGGFSHRAVASIVSPPDAALIVAAVNDYDRLRAIEDAARAVMIAYEAGQIDRGDPSDSINDLREALR